MKKQKLFKRRDEVVFVNHAKIILKIIKESHDLVSLNWISNHPPTEIMLVLRRITKKHEFTIKECKELLKFRMNYLLQYLRLHRKLKSETDRQFCNDLLALLNAVNLNNR